MTRFHGMNPPYPGSQTFAQVRLGCERAGRKLSDIDMWWLPITNVRESAEQSLHEIAPTLASTAPGNGP